MAQMRNYAALRKASQTNEGLQNRLEQQLGVTGGKLKGHDYLLLPGAKGNVVEAAERVFDQVTNQGLQTTTRVFFVDAEGTIHQFLGKPGALTAKVGRTLEDIR